MCLALDFLPTASACPLMSCVLKEQPVKRFNVCLKNPGAAHTNASCLHCHPAHLAHRGGPSNTEARSRFTALLQAWCCSPSRALTNATSATLMGITRCRSAVFMHAPAMLPAPRHPLKTCGPTGHITLRHGPGHDGSMLECLAPNL